MAPTYRQDLPPAGGYRPIIWEKVPLKPFFKGTTLFAGFTAVTVTSMYLYYLTSKKVRREKLEDNDAKLAVTPLIYAERDREFLKQCRRNRDEEAELMKNVPGWVIGEYEGEPIYKTISKEDWFDPNIHEYYAHADYKLQLKRQLLSLQQ